MKLNWYYSFLAFYWPGRLLKVQWMSIGSGHLQKGNALTCFKHDTTSTRNNSRYNSVLQH